MGGKIGSIPCRASCFASVDLKEKVEFILFFQMDRGKIASAARTTINSAPPKDAKTFAFLLSTSFYVISIDQMLIKLLIRVDIFELLMEADDVILNKISPARGSQISTIHLHLTQST